MRVVPKPHLVRVSGHHVLAVLDNMLECARAGVSV